MKNIMVDLETMGKGSNAAIIAIGAVEFDVELGLGREFYMQVNLESCVCAGLEVDTSTVLWWLQQSEEARAAFKHNDKAAELTYALVAFAGWVYSGGEETKEIKIWGNGATFDNVILSNAYAACGVSKPWGYKGDMCYRTLRALLPNVKPPIGTGIAHNALDDAKWQAQHAINCLKVVRSITSWEVPEWGAPSPTVDTQP